MTLRIQMCPPRDSAAWLGNCGGLGRFNPDQLGDTKEPLRPDLT